MTLADKMIDRTVPGCAFGTDCRKKSDRRFFRDLFSSDWEVLVIRHNEKDLKYDWFTLGGEGAGIPQARACC